MFCPNCGTNNPDNAYACGNCGTILTQDQPAYTQPEYSQPMYAQPANNQVGMPVSKKEYFKTMPSAKAKSLSLVSLILAVVLVVSVVATYFVVTNTSAENIPFIGLALDIGDTDGEFDDTMEDLEEKAQRLDEQYDIEKDHYSDEDQEIIEDILEAINDCVDSFSLNNIKATVNAYEDFDEIDDVEQIDGFTNLLDEIEELDELLNIVTLILIGFVVFILLFAALGGFLKNRGLLIVSLVFSIIHTLVLCGVLWFIILVAIHIALIVVLTQRANEYKNYKKTFGM